MTNSKRGSLRTITVRELVELLQDQDQDARVVFSTNYGDYHRTEQALPLKGEIDTVCVKKSAYSNSGFAVCENEHADGPDEDGVEPSEEDEQEIYLRIG